MSEETELAYALRLAFESIADLELEAETILESIARMRRDASQLQRRLARLEDLISEQEAEDD